MEKFIHTFVQFTDNAVQSLEEAKADEKYLLGVTFEGKTAYFTIEDIRKLVS